MLLTEGQVSRDAATVPCPKPTPRSPTASARPWRSAEPCIPGRRKRPVACDAELYKRRNLVERMFGRIKNRRRIATRYDRCAYTFAICIAATVIFWL